MKLSSMTPIAAALAMSVSTIALAETLPQPPAKPAGEPMMSEGKCGGMMGGMNKPEKGEHEGKCGAKKEERHEGKCGADKMKSGVKEGKCGGDKMKTMMDPGGKPADAKADAGAPSAKGGKEGKCGEGKCGAKRKKEMMKDAEAAKAPKAK
ncbi:hypothetical protein EV700_1604 [Fluviicoccus keumensis]|uniref:Low-complexity protein n=1 Tax=Fluviicoccus keumensis TaxID=1435465 RepID=A0A4Q7ZBJ9_9GAMM|nr:hypothetical protein [Fluviicoccus keumensis]RZU47209.1 hypothetical protein EV700_1604 [Fluviicoccus keumensis]